MASGEYGKIPMLKLETQVRIQALEYPATGKPLVKTKPATPIKHTWLLTKRAVLMLARDPFMVPGRIIAHFMMIACMFLVFGLHVGEVTGCPYDILTREGTFMENLDDEIGRTRENIAAIILTSLFIWFGALFPVVLLFPLEMNVFMKEHGNGWYSAFSYLMSKILSDLPLQLTIPNIMSIGTFYATGQPNEEKRLLYWIVLNLLIAVCSQALGNDLQDLSKQFINRIEIK